MTIEFYDPLTWENLMGGLARRFESEAPQSFREDELAEIQGPGIYALYYRGDAPFYAPLADAADPIYVGKAVPPGSRKGRTVREDHPALRARLRNHLRSIGEAGNLAPSDFRFRSLTVTPVWISLAERFLIDAYEPVWNVCLDGFGKHDSGRGRAAGKRSWWDTLHPGRPWAARERPGQKTAAEAERMVREFLGERGAPP